MTLKVDGTNGVLQAYDYQVLTTGFSYTFAAGTQVLVMNPAGTLATGTITLPASPSDGMNITITSTQTITALTINGNTGQTVVGKVTTLSAGSSQTFIYRLSNTTWYSQVNSTVSVGGVTSLNGVTGAVSTVALNDIGSFVIGRPANSTTYAVNSTIAGSSLYATGGPVSWYASGGFFTHPQSGNAASSDAYTLVNTGSWRCVAPCGQSYASSYAYPGLWVRYA